MPLPDGNTAFGEMSDAELYEYIRSLRERRTRTGSVFANINTDDAPQGAPKKRKRRKKQTTQQAINFDNLTDEQRERLKKLLTGENS